MRPFTVIDVPQRSPEWFAARLGRLTGSRASDAFAEVKKGEAAKRRNLRMDLALERITGRSQERRVSSGPMQDGIDREPEAYAAYEALTGTLLQRTGFLRHDELMAGVSLDGHVGDFEGIIEIKCPLPATHWEYLKTGRVPGDYYKQCVHGMYLSGAQWCDWLSYHPEFPEPLRAKLVRIERNEQEIASYALAVSLFLSEVERECAAIQEMAEQACEVTA